MIVNSEYGKNDEKNVLFETFIPISLTIRRDKLEFNLFYLMDREIE